MGQRVINKWAQSVLNKRFIWGQTDCHMILLDFLQINNPSWVVPAHIQNMRGNYNSPREALKTLKDVDVNTVLENLGYKRRPVNRIEPGDIVWSETDSFDAYLPVIFGESMIYANPEDDVIELKHISTMLKYYEVYRR